MPGRKILIVGGSGGIGGAIARACAERGVWPVVGYCRNRQRAEQTVSECGCGKILRVDLRRRDLGIQGALPDVDMVAIASGAMTANRSLLQSRQEEVLELLAVNALGPLRLIQRLAASSKPPRHFLFLLSTAIACRGSGPYALSKTAGLAVAKLLAGELAGLGVHVDAIVPGWTDTAMAGFAARASGRSLDEIRASHPESRILTANEMGSLCCRLLLGPRPSRLPLIVTWDRRISLDPIWQPFDAVLAFDRMRSSHPAAVFGAADPQSLLERAGRGGTR